ncbi:hypothetical protein BS50DRAFT_241228 [Corynespora cassiicola Philippines]|uniref:Uncharacterized protein n=1 Tax=Corynespora cassiicola Philippines TaxID=1448308 RepID=A0A2T2P2W0_CORCC|nr:hypothetical protein BS50DRAFT_241228 [Corynespora cassiicola Philippines]
MLVNKPLKAGSSQPCHPCESKHDLLISTLSMFRRQLSSLAAVTFAIQMPGMHASAHRLSGKYVAHSKAQTEDAIGRAFSNAIACQCDRREGWQAWMDKILDGYIWGCGANEWSVGLRQGRRSFNQASLPWAYGHHRMVVTRQPERRSGGE